MIGRLAFRAALLSCTIAAGLGGAAQAGIQPTASKYDARIQFVTYNPADVVKVAGVAGIATHIRLEKGEEYVTHAFGDAEAWSFAVEQSHVFIKPRADRASTNLIIVTDRRVYNFELDYRPEPQAGAVFQLSFHYPDTAAAEAARVRETAQVESAFNTKAGRFTTNYTMSGDMSIAPINVWDDGRFTYFKFPQNRDVPAIYMVDADGRESIVNRTVDGAGNDVVVAQKVNERWRLRLGGQALGVFNEDLIARRDAPIVTSPYQNTGTASHAVTRVLKGGE